VSAQRRGMGRGLAAILPVEGVGEPDFREVPVALIRPNPDQPRRSFDPESITALAESISEAGVIQPLVVRPLPDGRYELIAGERRWRAAREAGLEIVPALIRDEDEARRIQTALIENVAREDLNPVDEARACATLVEDLGLTKEELGKRLGRSRVAISNLIRLLELPEEALELIERGDLSEGHGRALLLCKDHAARRGLALEARDGGWSVRETERRARRAEGQPEPEKKERFTREIHPDLADALAAAEDTLAVALGQPVRVRLHGESGCRVELDFDSPADAVALAERILARAHLRAV
jgi:ParB family chromosome partitioning protein